MFDHIAHEMTSQQEIYQMIGQECVQQTLEVCWLLPRDIIVAFLPMDKLELERLILSLAVRMTCKTIPTVPAEEFCQEYFKIPSKCWPIVRREARPRSHAHTSKFTISRFLIW